MIAFASCSFVWAYDRASLIRLNIEQPHNVGRRLMRVVEFLQSWERIAYLVPVLGLAVGLWATLRNKSSPLIVECTIGSMWVLSLIWVGLAVLAWQVQNIPMVHLWGP